MIQVIHSASRLALRNPKPTRAFNIGLRPQLLLSIPLVQYYCSVPRSLKYQTGSLWKPLQAITPSLQFVRACSQRGAMCKGHAEAEGSVGVMKAREVLPTNVKPLHYNLTLEPDFDKFSYEGTVIIE